MTRPHLAGFNPTGDTGAREAHRALAREITRLVHGADALDAALKASDILFGAEIGDTSEETFQDVVGEVPTKELEKSNIEGAVTPLVELLVHSGLSPSKGQARKDIEGGGIYVNNVKSPDTSRNITIADLLFTKYILLRKGKRTYTVIRT